MEEKTSEKDRVIGHFEIKEKTTKRNRVAGYCQIEKSIKDANKDMFEFNFLYKRILKCN